MSTELEPNASMEQQPPKPSEERTPGLRVYRPTDVIEKIDHWRNKDLTDILREFVGTQATPELTQAVAARVTGIAHIGIEVRSIDASLAVINQTFPDAEYHIAKRFESVGIPERFCNSVGQIAVLESSKGYTPLELFQIIWKEDYTQRNVMVEGKMINHVALQVDSPAQVQELLNLLQGENSGITVAISPTENQSSGEVFGYVMNSGGRMLEAVFNKGKVKP